MIATDRHGTTCRIRPKALRRLKIMAALRDVKVQDILDELVQQEVERVGLREDKLWTGTTGHDAQR